MARKIIEANVGDKVLVRLQKLNCTGSGVLVEFMEKDGKTYPVVKVTETDGTGFGPLWEGTIKKYGGVKMICAQKDIISIIA